MSRRIIHTKILAAEKAAITQFFLDEVVPHETTVTPLYKIFNAYDKWRSRNKMAPSELLIDGFGRMFPKGYKRGPHYCPDLMQSVRSVFGLTLKGKV